MSNPCSSCPSCVNYPTSPFPNPPPEYVSSDDEEEERPVCPPFQGRVRQGMSFQESVQSDLVKSIEHQAQLIEMQKESAKAWGRIATSLETIANALAYAPEGPGAAQAKQEFEGNAGETHVELDHFL